MLGVSKFYLNFLFLKTVILFRFSMLDPGYIGCISVCRSYQFIGNLIFKPGATGTHTGLLVLPEGAEVVPLRWRKSVSFLGTEMLPVLGCCVEIHLTGAAQMPSVSGWGRESLACGNKGSVLLWGDSSCRCCLAAWSL